MKIFIPLAFAFALALGLIFVPPTMLSDAYAVDQPGKHIPRQPVIIPDSYIVTLKPEFIGEPPAGDLGLSNSSLKKQQQEILIEADQAEELIEPQGGNVTRIYDRIFNGFAVEGVNDVTPFVLDPAVDSIEPNTVNQVEAQYLPEAIDRTDLDRAVTTSIRPDNRESRPNIDVAVIDMAVAPNHPDLNVVARVNFVNGCGTGSPVIQCPAQGGVHGTHVAGSVAAKDNLGGVVGGMPGARIWSLVVCSVNTGCFSDAVLSAWNYLITQSPQFEIATMSLGSQTVVSSATETAGQNVINAGVTFFTSAGNENANTVNDHYCGVDAFICVSALSDMDGKCGGLSSLTSSGSAGISRDDQRAAFSNHGTDIDIMAPGVNILSTYPVYDSSQDLFTPGALVQADVLYPYIGAAGQGTYAKLSGTSMATPIAAGIGAAIKFLNPSFTPAQVKSSMQSSAYPQTQACDGFGRGGLVSGANSESSEEILYAQPY